MNIEFIELDIDWPYELSIVELRRHIISKLKKFGDPLRWAITSVTTRSEKKIQIISLEAVLIINQDKEEGVNP